MDISGMVAISEAKRTEYESYAPIFWRKASDSSPKQEIYFQRLLMDTDAIALVAVEANLLRGFAIGTITSAPPVYNPGGAVCVIDDFAVLNPDDWASVGGSLLKAVEREAKTRGAVLSVVVCARRDQAKREMLQKSGSTVVSEWHIKPL